MVAVDKPLSRHRSKKLVIFSGLCSMCSVSISARSYQVCEIIFATDGLRDSNTLNTRMSSPFLSLDFAMFSMTFSKNTIFPFLY